MKSPNALTAGRCFFGLLALTTAMGGCFADEGPITGEDEDTQETTSELGIITPTMDTCVLQGAEPFAFKSSDVNDILSSLTTSVSVNTSFSVNVDTSSGDCFINHAEVGSGIRVNGTFTVSKTVTLSGATASLEDDADGSDPYLLDLTVPIGDITFNSSGTVDLSVPCLGLDRRLNGTMHNVTAQIFFKPPQPGRNTFRFDHVSVDFSSVDVVNPDATISWFTPITDAINSFLASSSEHATLANDLAAALEGSTTITSTMPSTLNLLFWLEAPGTSSSTICRTTRTAQRGNYMIIP